MTTPKVGHIFRLAQIIQESCEQCTDQEATSLAKAILEHPGSRWCPQQTPVPEGSTNEELKAAVRKALENYKYSTEIPYFLDGTEEEPMMIALRAVACLARFSRPAIEPVPQGPTDEELLGLDELEAAWNSQADAFNSWDKLGADEIIWFAQQQALARWGRPAIEPVPVSERPILKSSDFNDAEGRCWCGTTAFTDERGDLPIDYPMAWELRQPCAEDDCVVPHWALPVPTSQGKTP